MPSLPRFSSWNTALPAFLVVLGLALAAWGLAAPERQLSPPYDYQPAQRDPTEDQTALAGQLGGTLEHYDLKLPDGDAVFARLSLLRRPQLPPLLIDWSSEVAEPLIRADVKSAEERPLLEVMRKHVPKGALVLALPELSRRLSAHLGVDAPLAGEALAMLAIPGPWMDRRELIQAKEQQFWALPSALPERRIALSDLIDALLADERYGSARLQALASGGEAYLVLHVQDIFSIGLLAPDRIAVGLRDFPSAGQGHDAIKLVRQWMAESHHAAYAAMRKSPEVARVFFLTEAKDKGTLIAQLLPFNTADLTSNPLIQLVHQHAGYWVYRIAPVERSANPPRS